MPKGIYKRKKKAGRPKGNRTKIVLAMKNTLDDIRSLNPKAKMPTWYKVGTNSKFDMLANLANQINNPTEPASFVSRLEVATVKYEQAIDYLVTTLKGN
jgi:hypothetical protein